MQYGKSSIYESSSCGLSKLWTCVCMSNHMLVHISGIHCHVTTSCISRVFVYFNLQYCIDTVQYISSPGCLEASIKAYVMQLVLYSTLQSTERLETVWTSWKSKKIMRLKDELPRSEAAQYAIGEKWRISSRRNEEAEPKQKHPVVDVPVVRSPICQRTILHRNLEF